MSYRIERIIFAIAMIGTMIMGWAIWRSESYWKQNSFLDPTPELIFTELILLILSILFGVLAWKGNRLENSRLNKILIGSLLPFTFLLSIFCIDEFDPTKWGINGFTSNVNLENVPDLLTTRVVSPEYFPAYLSLVNRISTVLIGLPFLFFIVSVGMVLLTFKKKTVTNINFSKQLNLIHKISLAMVLLGCIVCVYEYTINENDTDYITYMGMIYIVGGVSSYLLYGHQQRWLHRISLFLMSGLILFISWFGYVLLNSTINIFHTPIDRRAVPFDLYAFSAVSHILTILFCIGALIKNRYNHR